MIYYLSFYIQWLFNMVIKLRLLEIISPNTLNFLVDEISFWVQVNKKNGRQNKRKLAVTFSPIIRPHPASASTPCFPFLMWNKANILEWGSILEQSFNGNCPFKATCCFCFYSMFFMLDVKQSHHVGMENHSREVILWNPALLSHSLLLLLLIHAVHASHETRLALKWQTA